MGRLTTKIIGLELRNPTILAAGILGYTGLSLKRVIDAGVGAVVTKSIGLVPCIGYKNPTVVQLKNGLLNAMGLPNPGIDSYINEINQAKSVLTVPLIVRVYGYQVEDYILTAKKASDAGADAIVQGTFVERSVMEDGGEALKSIITKIKKAGTMKKKTGVKEEK